MCGIGALLLCLPALAAAVSATTPVADAAMRGDIETVRALLRDGADVNAPQGDGMTALHWAARRGSAELAEMLVHAGANVDAVTRVGQYSGLHLAAQSGSAPVVEILLDAGSDPHAASATGGATPLHFAAGAGSAAAIEALLNHGADVNAREAARQQTPLMWAASYNRVAAINALVRRGAHVAVTAEVIDISAREVADQADKRRRDQRRAALLEAATGTPQQAPRQSRSRPQESTRPRVPSGPPEPSGQAASAAGSGRSYDEPNEEEPLSYADLVGRHGGLTALLQAAREGHVEAVDALLAAGADINQVSAGDHTSPMLIAMLNGHFDLALSLAERGADPELGSDAGTTPLYAAINVHWAPKTRYPPQHAYRQQRATYLDVMRALLNGGIDPNVRLSKHLWYTGFNFDLLRTDTKGATPFWRAAYATDVEAMRLLVSYGADANIPTAKPPQRFRRTQDVDADASGLPPVPVNGPAAYPIHAASGIGYGQGYAGNAHRHVPDGWLPAVKYLIEEMGADVNARDLNGYTALHHAASRGDNEMIRYLISQGADVMVVSRRGQTTVDMANGPVQRIEPFPETMKLLESLGAINNHNCISC